MQQSARILPRFRTLALYHRSSSTLRRGDLTTGSLKHLQVIKTELHRPYLRRHFSPAHGWSNPSSRLLCRLNLKTIDTGRKSGLIAGLIVGTRFVSLDEDPADIAHCEYEDNKSSSKNVTKWENQRSRVGCVVRKLWVPSLCVLTISLTWQHPVSLLVNLIFLMWSTKPNPASIYMWVEQVRQQDALNSGGLDQMKAQLSWLRSPLESRMCQAAGMMHVEVRDNIFFCLARVSSFTKRSTLLGLLGDWWVISSSSSTIHTGVKLRNLIPIVGPFMKDQFGSLESNGPP